MKYVNVNIYKNPPTKHKKTNSIKNVRNKDIIILFCYTVKYINVNIYNKLVLLQNEVCKYKKYNKPTQKIVSKNYQ